MQLSVGEYLAFVDITLDGYRRALERLDDETVNARPDIDGANSPFAIVTHATAACRWWLLHIVIGHGSDRVRAEEFHATGTVAQLGGLIDDLHDDLHAVGAELESATELANDPGRTLEGFEWSVGTVAMHAYEELAQHLGHLELTVDLVA